MFANNYFKKFIFNKDHIKTDVDRNTNIIIVIPCFNEFEILDTIESIFNCDFPNCITEIIVVINSSENTSPEIIHQNRKTEILLKGFAKKSSNKNIILKVMLCENLPEKHAGAGLARKIGMDEALFRFNLIDNKDGVIVSLDADTLCKTNYLIEIEKATITKKNTVATIGFEHDLAGEFPDLQYQSITKYELYLRYYIEAMRMSNFPFAYYTIGSAFCVNANLYAKQGGMNKKKAGEDFYFLHKLFPLAKVTEINSTKVYPSSRTSNRVPFGTGIMVNNLMNSAQDQYLTYNLNAFLDIQKFLNFKNNLFIDSYENFKSKIPTSVTAFLEKNNFKIELEKILKQSPNIKIFEYRFYQWFTALRYFKFLNDSHRNGTYIEKELMYEANKLSDILYSETKNSYLDLLILYRKKTFIEPQNF